MSDMISRDDLLVLMQEWGAEGSAELVVAVMTRLGYDQKPAFSKAEFIEVMQGVVQHTREVLDGSDADAVADSDTREHMHSLLDSLERHAFPLLRQG